MAHPWPWSPTTLLLHPHLRVVSYASPSLTPSQFQQSTSKSGSIDYVGIFWNNVRAFMLCLAALTNLNDWQIPTKFIPQFDPSSHVLWHWLMNILPEILWQNCCCGASRWTSIIKDWESERAGQDRDQWV
jgi:hypothetical protein